MKDFAAIDFETANGERTSVCSVGVVIVRNGMIADRFYSLIHPEPDYYTYWNTKVHGLTQADTDNAPIFPEVWRKTFDESCLKAVFKCYQMTYPDYIFHCTLLKSRSVWPRGRHNLDIIAARCGYDLTQHHHALADAEACAAIALQIL